MDDSSLLNVDKIASRNRSRSIQSSLSPGKAETPRGNVSNPLFGRKSPVLERSASVKFIVSDNPLEQETIDTCFDSLDLFLEQKYNHMSKKATLSLMKNTWSKSLARLSPKGPKKYSEDGVSAKSLKVLAATSQLVRSLEEFIQEEYAFLDSLTESQGSVKSVETKVVAIYSNIISAAVVVRRGMKDKAIKKVLGSTIRKLEATQTSGNVHEETVESMNSQRRAFISNVVATLERYLQEQILHIRSYTIQYIGCMGSDDVLLFCALTRSLSELIQDIMDRNYTISALQALLSEKSLLVSAASFLELEETDKDIWDEAEIAKECPEGTGTLNQLVTNLTSTTNYDNNFTKSFIMTYQAFTKPWNLFDKLQQRFSNIPSNVPDAERNQVQIRVCIVLKYWIETRIFDFDNELMNELVTFVKNEVAAQHEEMANRLVHTLENCVEAYQSTVETQKLTMFSPSLVELYLERSVTQATLIREFPATVISQQICLIDLELFKKVEAVGFLGQSYEKAKRFYRATALRYFIRRLQQYAEWSRTLVLLSRKKHDRLAMVQKLLDVVQDLLESQNNFHAVAGIFSGLFSTSVTRQKISIFNELPKKHKLIWEQMETLQNPAGSSKEYRNALRSRTLPAIPNLTIFLKDLTMIDEGNPDTIDEFINFQKQDLIYNAIREVIVFQQSSYEHKPLLLFQHYLRSLPALDEDSCFDLSYHYEPRGADPSSIK